MSCRALTLLAAGAASGAFATNGYFSDGYGIKAEGLAGAGIAFPQDTLTVATNPAGLTAVADAFDIGADVFLPRRAATIDRGGVPVGFDGNASKTFYIPSIGYSRRVDPRAFRESLSRFHRVADSVGIFPPG
jgi:long-chain fatty acid transport protein